MPRNFLYLGFFFCLVVSIARGIREDLPGLCVGDGAWMVTYSANSAARVSDVVRDTSECAGDTCDSERGRRPAAVAVIVVVVVVAVVAVESSAS